MPKRPKYAIKQTTVQKLFEDDGWFFIIPDKVKNLNWFNIRGKNEKRQYRASEVKFKFKK